jgi:pullulanase
VERRTAIVERRTKENVRSLRGRQAFSAVLLLLACLGLAPVPGHCDPIPAGDVRIHYYRPDGNYSGWAVYGWNAFADYASWCQTEVQITGTDTFGVYFDVPVNSAWGNPPGDLGFIINNCAAGQIKDPGPDQHLQITQYNEAWVVHAVSTVYTAVPTLQQISNAILSGTQEAYWLDRTHLAIRPQYLQSGASYALVTSPTGGLTLTDSGVGGGIEIPLIAGGALTQDELTRYPQLASYAVLQVPASVSLNTLKQALKGQIAVCVVGSNGLRQYATGIQAAAVLDDLYYYPGALGVVTNEALRQVSLKLWAPTAQSVALLLFNGATDSTPAAAIPMQETNGVWVAQGPADWKGKFYLYSVKVWVPGDAMVDTNVTTDPYSIDIALNGTKSRITDLDSADTKPVGWDEVSSPPLASFSDMSLYELHVRDFSVGDLAVPAEHRGMYVAFADEESDGMRHLRGLARSGLKAVHILPSFHFASVNEDKSTWKTTGDLSQYPPDGQQQQAAVAAIQASDGYNWGYDPVHYMTPEGSYAVVPDHRVREYRTMVMGLHRAGLRVVQDVVFNHTSAYGAASSLDAVVPGYYHRLDQSGGLEADSCCADTASEHRMMEKLMIDTLVLNARQYKIDGYRFDLMSFHFLYNMQHIQAALQALTPEKDGVDGSKIYLYGEGWNFGHVANNQIGPHADQADLYGFGIGTFNDRSRDGIRGGSPFQDARSQGFATGLFTDSSDYENQNPPAQGQQSQLLQSTDWIRIALTGNLRDYTLVDSTGATVAASQVDYYGQAAGYTASPIEAINYCSAHDNLDLFDAVQLKASFNDSIATRARRQVMAASLVLLAEGIPFFQGGDDLLRSKDLDVNSYDSGDWFNKIDWSGQTANWGIGLPIASQNSAQWSIMTPLLSNPAYTPGPQDIAYSSAAFQDLLRIRYSTRLFRMPTFTEVQQNLTFLNTGPGQVPGVIVMKLASNGRVYGPYENVLVVFNATMQQVTLGDDSLKGVRLRLHPVQQHSADALTRQSFFDSAAGSAVVGALTTAVFVSAAD